MANDDITADWLKRISTAQTDAQEWVTRGENILTVYRNENERGKSRDAKTDTSTANIRTKRYNSLFANTEVIRPALFAKKPTPDVRRRFLDENDLATEAAKVMQDALSFFIDDEYKSEMDGAVKDYILAGRGHMRVRFIPTMEKKAVDVPKRTAPSSAGDSHVHIIKKGATSTTEVIHGLPHSHEVIAGQIMPATQPGEDQPHTHEFEDLARTLAAMQAQDVGAASIEIDANGTPFIEDVVFEEIAFEQVEWKGVIIPKVRRWRDVSWLAFVHNMTKADIEERFGSQVLEQVQFDDEEDGSEVTIEVFEVWDREKREVIHVSEQSDKPLEGPSPDPLGLEQFYPIPKPLTANPTSGTLIPVPDYVQYQELAMLRDDQTRKIGLLSRALRARGAYNGRYKELGEIIDGEDNSMIAIPDFGAIADKGGLATQVWMYPLKEVVEALAALTAALAETERSIDKLSGVADIMRGVTNPNEAMGTNRIKGQFATLRLRDRQDEIARFNRDVLRLAAELIANNFQQSTLSRVVGKDINPQIMTILRDDAIRDFNIDVETDSTIAVDEVAEQEATTKLMTGLASMVEAFGPAIESGIIPSDVALALFKTAMKPFKGAREIETILSSIDAPDLRLQAAQQQSEQKDMQIQALQDQMQSLINDRTLEETALQIAAQEAEAKAINADGKLALDVEKEENKTRIEDDKLEQKAESEHADRLVKLVVEDENLSFEADREVFRADEQRNLQ